MKKKNEAQNSEQTCQRSGGQIQKRIETQVLPDSITCSFPTALWYQTIAFIKLIIFSFIHWTNMIVGLLGYKTGLRTGDPRDYKTDIVLILMSRLESQNKPTKNTDM